MIRAIPLRVCFSLLCQSFFLALLFMSRIGFGPNWPQACQESSSTGLCVLRLYQCFYRGRLGHC